MVGDAIISLVPRILNRVVPAYAPQRTPQPAHILILPANRVPRLTQIAAFDWCSSGAVRHVLQSAYLTSCSNYVRP